MDLGGVPVWWSALICLCVYMPTGDITDSNFRDQINGPNLSEQLATVSKVFWPRNVAGATTSIIPCSSLMGLSARALLDQSTNPRPNFKPAFESFWDKTLKQVEYPVSFDHPP
jgi:hypothetical protein